MKRKRNGTLSDTAATYSICMPFKPVFYPKASGNFSRSLLEACLHVHVCIQGRLCYGHTQMHCTCSLTDVGACRAYNALIMDICWYRNPGPRLPTRSQLNAVSLLNIYRAILLINLWLKKSLLVYLRDPGRPVCTCFSWASVPYVQNFLYNHIENRN